MSPNLNSPRTLRGGLVFLDPKSSQVKRVVVLQYNPDQLSRSLQVQAVSGDAGDRLDALRLRGAPIETIKLEAELDATDQLERGNPTAIRSGVAADLAALESALYPSPSDVQRSIDLAAFGTLEVAPLESPLTLFIWGEKRILPVRITEFSVTEDAFDPSLNPLRATVSLSLRVMGVNDLPRGHRGAAIFMAHHRSREALAAAVTGDLSALGIRSIP
ncbi:hypothetical protein [Arthrobacter sp. B0490]|uniref:CIS tube protein n=1 Tax=Arthrobacter sp. B0490 TaxID=2058891 RepID=UPI000CE49A8C|nr:hypothetical protein [Arthrobacter sp. B0490]